MVSEFESQARRYLLYADYDVMKREEIVMEKISTGCYDVAGDEIFIGDTLLIKSTLTEKTIIVRKAERRTDSILGFKVPYQKGYLMWDADDHDACYEVMRIGNVEQGVAITTS